MSLVDCCGGFSPLGTSATSPLGKLHHHSNPAVAAVLQTFWQVSACLPMPFCTKPLRSLYVAPGCYLCFKATAYNVTYSLTKTIFVLSLLSSYLPYFYLVPCRGLRFGCCLRGPARGRNNDVRGDGQVGSQQRHQGHNTKAMRWQWTKSNHSTEFSHSWRDAGGFLVLNANKQVHLHTVTVTHRIDTDQPAPFLLPASLLSLTSSCCQKHCQVVHSAVL